MECDKLNRIKGNYLIYKNKDFIILMGKSLYIYRNDFTLIVNRKDIYNAHKLEFLSNNRILVGGGKKANYRLIELKNGIDVWSVCENKNKDVISDHFAITPDSSFAYEYYFWKDGYHIVQINLLTGEYEDFAFNGGLHVKADIMYDENGALCVLQNHYENIANGRVSQNGIQYVLLDGVHALDDYYWKHKWVHDGSTISKCFAGSTELILTNDLQMYEPQNNKLYYLLDGNATIGDFKCKPLCCWLGEKEKYLVVMHETCNSVIDLKARKLVALYKGRFTKGCIVGDEFWISSGEGIRRLPFPMIEDIH